MNFNFHLVDTCADFSFDTDIEAASFEALMSDDSCECILMALAELVDWELATMGALTGHGKRCERALKQRILRCEEHILVSMAGRSGYVNALFQQLTFEAETIVVDERLCA